MRNRIFRYEIVLGNLLLLMPLILVLFDNGNVRKSISDYVYMEHNQVYYFLLFLAGTMFANNGALWVKNYNIALGVLLCGVALTPHNEFPIIHATFAALFFILSMVVMVYFSSTRQRPLKIIASVIIIGAMVTHLVFNHISMFAAEWIGIFPICIHFLGESEGSID